MAKSKKMNAVVRYLVGVTLLAAAYYITARFGLLLNAVSGFATLVWPPTGISLAAMVIFGPAYWPGVFIGAFLANSATGAMPPVALGIAAGNAGEALLGWYFLKRMNVRPTLDSIRDVMAFIVLAAFASTTFSATVGVTTLYLGGVVAGPAYAGTWIAWWVGDLLGDLIVAPLILIWYSYHSSKQRSVKTGEGLILALLLIITGLTVFGGTIPASAALPFTCFIFVPLIWAALSFGMPGAATTAFVMSAIAIWGTSHGYGPFAMASLSESLLFLQLFMAVGTTTALIMAAVVSELRRAEKEVRSLNTQLQKRVTERSAKVGETEAELRRSEEMLRTRTDILQAVLHNVTEGVAAIDVEGKPILMNPAGMKIMGLSPSELTMPFEQLADRAPAFYPDGKTPVPFSELPLARALRGEDAIDVELLVRPPQSAKDVHVICTAKPVKDDDGKVIGGIVLFREQP